MELSTLGLLQLIQVRLQLTYLSLVFHELCRKKVNFSLCRNLYCGSYYAVDLDTYYYSHLVSILGDFSYSSNMLNVT